MFKDVKTVAVYVSDLERAKKFYTDILGFHLSAQVSDDLCFLKASSGLVHIYLKGGMIMKFKKMVRKLVMLLVEHCHLV